MARKPDEITIASLQQYRDDLQGEYNELEDKQEGEKEGKLADQNEEEMEILQSRMDSVDAALDAIESVE